MDKDLETDDFSDLMELSKLCREMLDRREQDPQNGKNPPGFDRLCKRFLDRDTWTKNEAAALLNGCSPSRDTGTKKYSNLDDQIRQTVKLIDAASGVALKPVNPNEKPRLHRFRTKQVLDWARVKKLLPEELAAVTKSVPPKPRREYTKSTSEREQVLSAALAVMGAYPEQCMSGTGTFQGTKIADLIDQKSPALFENEEPPLARGYMERIINDALHRMK